MTSNSAPTAAPGGATVATDLSGWGEMFARGRMEPWLLTRADRTPDRAALTWRGEAVSFRQLVDAARSTAAALRALGVGVGDRVGLLLAGGASFQVALQACALVGAVAVPLNTRLRHVEWALQARDGELMALVCDAPLQEGAAAVAGAVGCPGLCLADRPWGEAAQLTVLQPGASVWTARTWAPLAEGAAWPVDLAHPQSIVYTSGTTGRPKGAVLTWGNVLANAVLQAFTLGMPADERYLAVLPVFHVGGMAMLWRSVLFGVEVEMLERFDAAVANAAIDAGRVTALSVVATVLQRMLDAHGDRPYAGRLRLVLVGGGPAPVPLLRRALALGVPVATTYGLTETASQCVTMTPGELAEHLGSAGRPLWGTRVRIVRDGSVLPPGEVGEIQVSGPTVMVGYWRRPEETARALMDGWLRTGDLGHLDAQGYLYVDDRRDDLVVTGGENVYPAEVEATLLTHPRVAEACVVGLPDPTWGRAVTAVVVLRPGEEVADGASLRAFVRERLADYKAPRAVYFVTDLPHTAAGKLRRHTVRETLERLGGEAAARGRDPAQPWHVAWDAEDEAPRGASDGG